ncbi:MAG: PHP domain-containing protein [Clostridia bacterium]|nr:PHP domain-containing protein [Clostridia bacterium]
MMANYFCDLHSHTNLSDGNDTVEELIAAAVREGVKIFALTDHDVLPPKTIIVDGKEVDTVEYAKSQGVLLVPGVEFSAETLIEDTHMVCLGCDWSSPELKAIEDEVKQSKVDAYVELLDRLTAKGMPLTLEEVLASRPGVTPDTLQKKMIFDMIAKKGYTKDWAEAKLMVKADKSLSVDRKKPDALRVLKAAHDAGGIVILAHPYLIAPEVNFGGKMMSRAEYIQILIDNGLDGIEKVYPYHKTSSVEKRPNEVLYQEIEDMYGDKLLISGGSDYHNDAKKGTKNPRVIGEAGVEEPNVNKILRKVYGEDFDYKKI